ncbi:hypothetical protein ACWCOP_08055 [Maricaulaceae bacterium MS644]
MALVDWRLLTSSELLARIADNASFRDQAQTFSEVVGLIISEHLRSVILDMDHAVSAKQISNSGKSQASALAMQIKDSGLERFALVHRGHQDAGWEALVAELRDCGVLACGFETVDDAKIWFGSKEAPNQA